MNTDIHRLLDEAFAGIEMTPDAQDLKEEVRANLVARTAELEAAGRSSADAARQAIAELGDVRDLLDGAPTRARARRTRYAAMQLRHRVRPKTGLRRARRRRGRSSSSSASTLAVLGATGVLPLPVGLDRSGCSASRRPALGLARRRLALAGDDDQPPDARRTAPAATAWPPSSRCYGLGLGGLVALGALPDVVRRVRRARRDRARSSCSPSSARRRPTATRRGCARRSTTRRTPRNRFEEEPETAARFGIYTAVIWLVTFGVIVVLVFTVGWWWAPLAFLGGFAAMMLLLARMLFGPKKS